MKSTLTILKHDDHILRYQQRTILCWYLFDFHEMIYEGDNMGNTSITNPGVNPYTITLNPPLANTTGVIPTAFNNTALLTTNNYTLYQGTLPNNPPPTITAPPVIDSSLLNDLTGISYEQVYQNLASYPHTIDSTNKKLVTTVYNTGPTTSITMTTDTRIPGTITSVMSGNTPTNIPLTKTTTMDASYNIMNVTYA